MDITRHMANQRGVKRRICALEKTSSCQWAGTIIPLPEISHPRSGRPLLKKLTWAWWNGPLTQEEAALRCGCTPAELCPGPLAAIDEGDKIRTIYDGSWGQANSHIQQNTVEKTTAPTIMDCVQAIHWFEHHKGEIHRGGSLWHRPGVASSAQPDYLGNPEGGCL
jgi:hypothetical protein